MTSINVQNNIRNEELKNYPKMSINSIPCRFKLMISSTNGAFGKCLFLLLLLFQNSMYFNPLMKISLDSVFSIEPKSIVIFLIQNSGISFFHFNYNHNFLRQIDDYWNELQIDFDYETRKYFWTQMAIGRSFTIILYIIIFTLNYSYLFYAWYQEKTYSSKDFSLDDVFNYVFHIIFGPVAYYNFYCQSCVLIDLLILAQTALQFNAIKLKKLYKESVKDDKILNIDVIADLRKKYLSTHRLVDKINEIMSPSLFLIFMLFVSNSCDLFYALIFLEHHLLIKLNRTIRCVLGLILLLKIAHLAIQVYAKSQELLMTVYKTSLKTDSIRILNQITLFLNCNEIGFSFGGLFMLTTSSLSTLFSILTTIVIAIPSFNKHENTH
uniref:Gustatory receptor n=1 Tax=Tetranychus urticae TaxID=32264 RepID=T1KJE1_TETUR